MIHRCRLTTTFGVTIALSAAVAIAVGILANVAIAGPGKEPAPQMIARDLGPNVAVTVDGETITTKAYNTYLHQFSRRRFYHGKAPKDQVDALKVEVAERMVLHKLLIREARKRGIEGDREMIEKKIAAYVDKLATPADHAAFEKDLPDVRQQLLDSSRVKVLEEQVRSVANPTDSALVKYYRENLESFTEPQKERVAILLVGVNPSDSAKVWDEAARKAQQYSDRLKVGADFAELAKKYSNHESAANGGDLGYIHRGILAKPAQDTLDTMKAGDISAPVQLLQGYAILKLIDRKASQVQDFAAVKDRITEHYKRAEADRLWWKLISGIREKSEVVFNAAIIPVSKTAVSP